jgi:site-specific recombinase XerD
MNVNHDQFAAEYLTLHQISEVRRRRALKLFAEIEQWLGRDLHTIQPEDLNGWMAMKIGENYDANTVRFWLNMLRPYLRWAWKTRLIDADQWLRLSEVGPPRGASGTSTPRPYKRIEIQQFWADLDEAFPQLENDYYLRRYVKGTCNYRRIRQHLRHAQTQAIVSLALIEGLRRKEIYGLSLDELHPDNAYLLVHGKRVDHREKTREVPYAESAREAVRGWLRLRKLMKPRHKQPWLALQAPKPQRPMAAKPFNELLASVGDGYELHRLRHTFATERLRAKMPIEQLQRVLGHASLAQTLCYAQLLREDLAGTMDDSDETFMRAVGRLPAPHPTEGAG